MDIFEKIDNMFEDENISRDILNELKEIKNILKLGGKSYNKEYKKTLPKAYYRFVNKFRDEMAEDNRRGYFPEFFIDGIAVAINSNRLMYNKETGRLLPRYRAFEIYEKLYDSELKKENNLVF